MASDTKPIVGWIGLGMMGWPMARHMVEAGYDVRVFDLRPEVSQRFAGEIGGEVAPSLEALGAASDIVVTMVPDGKAARMALVDGADNASKGMKKGAVAIDMSSSEPTGTVELGAALKEKGIVLCDAPVSGGTWRAEEGSLAIMLGGADEAALDAAEGIMEPMSRVVVRTGPLGSGHAMKCLNNYLSAIALSATNEAILVGAKFGLDPNVMIDVINVSTGRSNNTETKFKPSVLTRKFDAGFATALMTKDVGIAAGLAESQGQDMPILNLLTGIWREFNEAHPGSDHSASIQYWEERNGEKLEPTKG
ncbi:NAD(P)-dependent oxidoreductase [Nisaea nitritireducens]|uniref:NAD(P)-dependent oxidoreductase n=1 Tax=Nisaea nitritireducens TaxID=568392 RepID=UPI0018671084|nr:NAD(P)-dependent oxidoreductase [Nisaea nitritireducens]